MTEESTTARLARLGFTHRRATVRNPTQMKHDIFHVASGEHVACLDVFEANDLCDWLEGEASS